MIKIFFSSNIIKLPYISIILLKFFIIKIFGGKPDICKLMIKLGPSFIKFGQTLSVRPDIIGEDYANRLSYLRDKVPPFSSEQAKQIIAKELGKNVNQLFSEFNSVPVAAASIAQVHRAITLDGHKIAVKILRPKIEKRFKSDLALFYFLVKIANIFPQSKRLRLKEIVDLFALTVNKELDLRLEAAASTEIKENLAKDANIYIPKIYWQYTTHKIMASEWIDGIPIDNIQALKEHKINLNQLSQNIYLTFLNQVYRDGFFHADIHQGNIFISNKGIIIPVDFGITGRIDEKTRYYVAEILRGFLSSDYEHIAKIHFAAGYVDSSKNLGDFITALRAIGEPIKDMPAKDISLASLLTSLFKTTKDFEMQTQPQLLLLQKTLILVEGLCQDLDPEINLWDCARPWIKQWAKDNISVGAQIKNKSKDLLLELVKFPEQLKKIDVILNNIAKIDEKKIKTSENKLSNIYNNSITNIFLAIILFVLTLILLKSK